MFSRAAKGKRKGGAMPFKQPSDPAPVIQGYDDWWYLGKDDVPPAGRPPDILLRGAGPATFQLVRGFAYQHGTDPVIEVDRHKLNESYSAPNNSTDFASVPSLFWWLIASYGHHTRAALIHDQLWEDVPNRKRANLIFRDALAESSVAFLRRWIMWTGVDAGRRWALGSLRRLALIAEAVMVLAFFVSFAFWAQPWIWSSLGWIWDIIETGFGWPWGELDALRDHWPSRIELGSGGLPLVIFGVGVAVWWQRWLLATLGLGLVLPPLIPELIARLTLFLLEIPFWIGHRLGKGDDSPIPSPAPTLLPTRTPSRV
jgi:uncharacterized protein DUF1353